MRRLRKHVCVIIDAYSTTRQLAPAFAGLGYDTVHVQTLPELSDQQRDAFGSCSYVENIIFDGDLQRLIAHLGGRYPGMRCIVPGIESGVTLADQLSEHFKLRSNGTALSPARRDKYAMAQAVQRAGLQTIPCLKTADAQDALAWARQQGTWPVVLKPKSSSGTFGFNICQDEPELLATFARLLHSQDIFKDVVDEVLVQPLVLGQEYAVNFVSCRGQHLVTDIWRTDKSRRGQSKVYERETLVLQDDPHFQAMTRYVARVLDALGIAWGPSHTEVMVTPQGEVVLIETAARMMGALDVSMVTQAYGYNPVQLTAEAYLLEDRFLARLQAPLPERQRHACMVQMLSSSRGTLAGFDLDRLQGLPSFHGADLFLHAGEPLVPTIDSYTSPGLIFLSHADPKVIDLDYETLRELEKAHALYLTA
jgi:hypothetical protein